MRVIDADGFAVYIYDDEHPPPHCHVIYNNEDEVVISLPFLEVLYGKKIKRRVRRVLENNLDLLLDTWDDKHPLRN